MSRSNASIKRFSVRQLAVVGMLSAVSIMLGLTGYGFIPLPIANATIMHIPVIIGAILEGPMVGVAIGLIFGVFSIFQNLATPKLLSFALINPLVSVLPRILIGIIAYYCYRIKFIKYESIRIGVGAAIGSLVNTVGVLGMIYILYAAKYAEAKGISPADALKTIYALALTNGIPEAIIAVIVSIPVVMAVKKIRRT